jgi:hypothetical protein
MSDWRAKALELFPDMQAEIHAADSLGEFWIELSARFRSFYTAQSDSQSAQSPQFMRAICLYAIWCTRSDSVDIQGPAWIEFYENLPRFALQSNPSIYKRIVDDLVSNLGIAEMEKQSSTIGAFMTPDENKKFFTDVSVAEAERQKRSRKR